MKITAAKKNDIEEIAMLNIEVHDMHVKWYPEVYKKLEFAELIKFIEDLMTRNDIKYFVAKENDKVIGYIKLNIVYRENIFMNQRNYIDIDQISVTDDSKGKGIGKALIKKAEVFASELGIKRLTLSARTKNINAITAYKALGFQVTTVKMELDF